jgi:hypothetical protein
MSGSDQANADRPSGSSRRVLVNGRVLEGRDFDECCEKYGMCPICGKVKVKEAKKGTLFGSLTPIPIVCNDFAEIKVYKGYCISPTCFTLEQACELGGTDKKNLYW